MKTLLERMAWITLFLCFVFLTHTQAQVTHQVDAFDAISVTGNIEVLLEPGEEEKATIYADGIPESEVSVKVANGTLRLRLLNSIFYKDDDVRVVVQYRRMRGIKASAGARISSDALIETDKLEARASSGAKIALQVRLNALEANVSEGARLELEGKTEVQNASVSTGGHYQALDLECNRTYIRSNTGGQAQVVANQVLEASANTGGKIEYRGNPEKQETKTLISGGVKKI